MGKEVKKPKEPVEVPRCPECGKILLECKCDQNELSK